MKKIIILEIILVLLTVFCLMVVWGKINFSLGGCRPEMPKFTEGGPLWELPPLRPCSVLYSQYGFIGFGILALINLALIIAIKIKGGSNLNTNK